MLILTNILLRVFHAEFPFSSCLGTLFTIDVEEKQYIVTSGHALTGIKQEDMIRIQTNTGWSDLPVKLVDSIYNKDIPGEDIGVIVADIQLSASDLNIKLGLGNISYGQDVRFLGFPFGLNIKFGATNPFNTPFPMPLVKSSILSGFSDLLNNKPACYLDGHNNVGFSGGPAFVMSESIPQVIGVVTSFLEEKIGGTVSNSGIMVCSNIQKALNMIKNNPIGFKLTD